MMRGRAGRALIVDEDVALLSRMSDALRDVGWSTDTVPDAESSLTVTDGSDIDLLVTAVVMSGVSGVGLAEALRRRHPGLPVVFVSDFLGLPYGADLGTSTVYVRRAVTSDGLRQAVAAVMRISMSDEREAS